MRLPAVLFAFIGCAVVFAAARVSARPHTCAGPDVEVTVTVAVTGASGKPLPDVRLMLNDQRLGIEHQCKTNAAGQATATLRWPAGQVPSKLWVTVTQRYEKALDSGAGEAAIERYKTLIQQNHFEPFYEVAIPSAGGSVSLPIAADEAISVTGQLASSMPANAEAMATSHQAALQPLGGFSRAFVVRGLKKGSRALVCVHQLGEPETKAILLEPSQTVSDVNVGEVNIGDCEGKNIVRMVIPNSMILEEDMPQGGDNVTVFSEDGTKVFGFGFDRSGRVWRHRQLRTPVALPAGKYYVAAGLLGITCKTAAVWGVIRQGAAAADAAGIPSIQVTNGGTNEFSIDASVLKAAGKNAPSFP